MPRSQLHAEQWRRGLNGGKAARAGGHSGIAKHRYTVSVSAAQSFAGKLATFQRYRSTTKLWVKVKRVLLKANTTGVAPTVITSAKFRSAIRARQLVRVVLGQKQVGACYLAGRSNTIRS